MTVGMVIAGAIAKSLLEPRGIEVFACTRSIGDVEDTTPITLPLRRLHTARDSNEPGAIDPARGVEMATRIAGARREGDSLGGTIAGVASGLPVGLGEPFFDSVESEIAHMMFSIPAIKAIEFGSGFEAARMRGSEHNDPFYWGSNGQVATRPTTRAGSSEG